MEPVNKDMKRCSTSVIVRKMQIRATIRYLVTAVRMVIIGKLRTINVGVDVEKRESSYTVDGKVNRYNHDGERCGGSLKS